MVTHFAEIFVTGEHDGVYHITEQVEDGSNRVDFGDTGFLLEIDQPDRLDPDDVSFQTPTYLINIKELGLAYSDPEFAQVRQHINEFTTHDLVRTRTGPGGQQVYWCHFPRETLQALHGPHGGG